MYYTTPPAAAREAVDNLKRQKTLFVTRLVLQPRKEEAWKRFNEKIDYDRSG